MITSAEEYYAALFKIHKSGNIPSLALLLPRDEYIYKVDLDSRIIESPEFLSVVDDHESETVYFLVDRFFDNVDLSETACIIQYVNAAGDERIYSVPFYDVETYGFIKNEDGTVSHKMLVPWCIEGDATRVAGNIKYSIRFFKVDKETNSKLEFVLNTLPAISQIKEGLRITETYSLVENVLEEEFNNSKYSFYIKTESGDYQEAKTYSADTEYYVMVDGYNPSASKYEALLDKVMKLQRGNQTYWYNATDPELL